MNRIARIIESSLKTQGILAGLIRTEPFDRVWAMAILTGPTRGVR